MKKRFNEEQIIGILKEAEAGPNHPHPHEEACMKHFDNKVAAITGAVSGMGRALAVQLAGAGCHLSLADRNAPGLTETERIVRTLAPVLRVTTCVLDVADLDAVYAWADETAALHGHVNLVYNNAGVAHSSTIEGMTALPRNANT